MSSALQVHGLPGKRRAYLAKTSSAAKLSMVRIGNVVIVTAITTLVGTPVYYHWFMDGALMGSGTSPRFTLTLEQAQQARIEVFDTLDPNFDPLSAPPAAFPGRYTIHWVRSLSTDVKEYRVERTIDGGANWTRFSSLRHDAAAWDYQVLTDRLADLTDYGWRVIPVDHAGNDGTPLVISIFVVFWSGSGLPAFNTKVVRIPDSPKWTYTWNAGTQRVTYAAA